MRADSQSVMETDEEEASQISRQNTPGTAFSGEVSEEVDSPLTTGNDEGARTSGRRQRKPSSKIRATLEPLQESEHHPRKSIKGGRKFPPRSKSNLAKSEEAVMPEREAQAPQDEDNRLYCICLGTDDKTPMIQCEGCDNWYHFRCLELTEEEAKSIQVFYCEMCEEADIGHTQKRSIKGRLGGGSNVAVKKRASSSKQRAASDDSGPRYKDDDEDEEPAADHVHSDASSEYDPELNRRISSAKRAMATQGKKRKSKRPEGVSDDELSESNESDEEYEEGESNRSPHKRTKSTSSAPVSASKERVRERTKTTPKQTARQVSSSKARPSSSTMETAKALEAANAKREACTNQFASVFDPIFDRPPPGLEISKPKKKEACPRARNFASHVEKELMKSYGDTDPRGFPVPGQKYIDRFRTLYSNLRSNADLKTRIARSDIDANALVNITDHDLQSAELRAMAESVRAQSMKGSVKQRMELPSAKITHKGMEAIEGSSDAFVAAEKANKRAMDDQSELQKPALSKSISGPESPGDLRISQSPLARSQFTPAMDSPMKDDEDGTGQAMPSPQLNRTPSSSKANFDLNSLWGNVRPKAANSPEIGPDGLKPESGTPEGSPPPDDAAPQFDPFDFSADRTAEVDFQLDDHRPEPPSPSVKIPAARTVGAKDAPKVWSGDIITVEDGGFPASASQVAGRNIGSSPETWKQLMSSTLHVAGRIETKKATDYLVQNVFAPSRELFVIAFDPILSGPSTAYPERPVAEKTLRYHAHLIKHFGSKKKPRVGVISPPKKSASNVKDFYLVPLLATDPLPEYVELLERQNLGERRERDLFLGVFVVSRGQFATVEEARPIAEATAPAVSVVPASRPGPVASQSAADQAMALIAQLAPQTASHGLPSPAPVPPQARSAGDIANLDQSALESLLNDPSTLQSLLAVDSSLKASFMANPNLPAALTTNTATTRTVANAPGLIQEMQSNARPAQPYIHPSRAQAILNHGQPYPGPPNYGRR